MKTRLIIITIIFMVLQSCGTIKKSVPASAEVEDQSLIDFRNAYQEALPEVDNLQIRSKIDATLKGKSHSASLKLYVQQDELIWANVSILGITGARAKITPESVQAYEVLDKTYIDSDFSYFNQRLHVDFITFDRLKQLLLGQLFLIEPWSAYSLETTSDNRYALHYKLNESLAKNPQEGKYIHTFYLDSAYRLSSVDIVDSKTNTKIQVNYSNWMEAEGKNFPGQVRVLVKSENDDKVELEYNNFNFSEMNPPFRIPNNYTERNIK